MIIAIANDQLPGALPPTITTSSVMSTSATVSWTQPPFSFTPTGYTIVLTQLAGDGQTYCMIEESMVADIGTSDTSRNFIGLEAFRPYRVQVTANFNEFGLTHAASNSMDFNTLSSGKVYICP